MSKNKLKIGIVQESWHGNQDAQKKALADGIYKAAEQGAMLVCLQELCLSPYFCTSKDADPNLYMEDLYTGPTATFISTIAKEAGVCITGSLFEKDGFNTAVAYDQQGKLIGFTRKQHIPSGEKYHEDFYFKPGDSVYPLHSIAGHFFGLPTCYDQWFPELSRIYSLKGTEALIYPTAIGGEPTAPGFDSQPMWEKVIVAQGIIANTFMIVINRVGIEEGLEFYGSSFISDPEGNIIVKARRDKAQVLVAEVDFSKRELWGRLFPFAKQRQPSSYSELVTEWG
ncbi:MAG: hydrolase [Legionellales bacterium RIFCSPHIGHO2_12_FULL_35_11]|nr:MAG: hydrolase [Legionellales bacterium RIFCSPHIGHO2_12_FULL_35_11]